MAKDNRHFYIQYELRKNLIGSNEFWAGGSLFKKNASNV